MHSFKDPRETKNSKLVNTIFVILLVDLLSVESRILILYAGKRIEMFLVISNIMRAMRKKISHEKRS